MSLKLFGILGGMGPQASLRLCKHILLFTRAKKDQEHLPYLLYNNPQVPDRTQAILGLGDSPVSELLRSSLILKNAGCHFLIMPCNTAHYFLPQLSSKISIPFIHMIDLTFDHLQKVYPHFNKIGILATSGTLVSGIYHDLAIKKDYTLLSLPNDLQEQLVMRAIYSLKAGKMSERDSACQNITDAAYYLIKKGAHVIVTACSEIPLLLNSKELDVPVVDPVELLAKEAILRAKT